MATVIYELARHMYMHFIL